MRLFHWLKKKAGYAKVAPPKKVRHSLYDDELLEAFRDEYYGFRRLRGSVFLQDIMPLDKIYLSRVARAIFYTSPVAKKVVMTPIIWYFSGGLCVVSKNKKIQRAINQFLEQYHDVLHDMMLAYMLDGELIVPILVLRNGMIEYGYIDGLSVVEVRFSTENGIFPELIRYTKDIRSDTREVVFTKEERRIYVLRNNQLTPDVLRGERDYCLYFKANSLPTYRGRSFVEQLIDVIYNLDNYIQDIIVQNQLMGSVLWDITMTGASKDEIDNRRNELIRQPPPPGSFVVHNENEQWTLVEKKYHGEAQRIDSEILLRYVALGSFYDVNWLGVETREDMYFQTTKFFEYMFNRFNDIIRIMVRNYLIAMQLNGLLPKGANVDDFTVSNASHNILLFKQTAITFVQLSNGLKVATDKGWVTDEVAKKILHEVVNVHLDNVEVGRTLSTNELMSIINTLITAYNYGVVDEQSLKETLQYYIDKSNFELRGGTFVNPSGMSPAKSTGIVGERVEPTGGQGGEI